MKDLPVIQDTWQVGKFIGLDRAHGRVTIEPDWYLNPTGRQVGTSKKGPFRWFQRYTNDQTELEVPNIKSIEIDRSIDTDAGTCNITMYNTNLDYLADLDTVPSELGQPGYYTWNRGEADEAVARWNHQPNDWNNLLVPNALVRTYEGWGGYEIVDGDIVPMSIPDAIEAGNLTLTGVWLVDKVKVGTDAFLTLACRDMGKLLIEQVLFPPLVPSAEYPLHYFRWIYEQFNAAFQTNRELARPNAEEPLRYRTSSADAWYGANADIHGHRGTDSTDGNPTTYALSPGSGSPNAAYATDYWEYSVDSKINAVYVHPWGGNYQMFVSVRENGVWQSNGAGNIPYDNSGLAGSLDEHGDPRVVDTDADIPFVMQTGVPWEQGKWYQLPRQFRADRIRITFRNHTQSQYGPNFYRCGLREVKARVSSFTDSPPTIPWTFDTAPCRSNSDPSMDGYWVVDDIGYVFAFGDARRYPENARDDSTNNGIDHPVVAIAPAEDGLGYWTLQINGRVHAYGSAIHHGDMFSSIALHEERDFIDMAPTPSGDGYWLLQRDGTVHAFGDAVHHGNMTLPGTDASHVGTGIESHPTDDGYWIVNGNGEVKEFGALPHLGDVTSRSGLMSREWVRCIVRTEDGDGYWLLGGASSVYAFGTAQTFGEISFDSDFTEELSTTYRDITWSMTPSNHDTGYLILQADGRMSFFGNANFFGYPGGEGTIRKPGNYKDYTDIIREILLWSGWWLQKDSPPANAPPEVFGNLETTGAYADGEIGEDRFDKRSPMEVITELKEIVGYIFHIDEAGGAHFETPNWWQIGNFDDETGEWVDIIPEIDEAWNLTGYDVEYGDEAARSEIIISTEQPTEGNWTTKTTRFRPKTADILRGMTKPAIWTNGVFENMDEQRIMAELIGLHIWFSLRAGQVTCPANPAIGIDDQVRIFERITSESFIHYVRGVSTSHDLETGRYEMTLTTNWLGNENFWAISADSIPVEGTLGSGSTTLEGAGQVQISQELIDWLSLRNSEKLTQAVDNGFLTGRNNVVTHYSRGDVEPPSDTGQADGQAA